MIRHAGRFIRIPDVQLPMHCTITSIMVPVTWVQSTSELSILLWRSSVSDCNSCASCHNNVKYLFSLASGGQVYTIHELLELITSAAAFASNESTHCRRSTSRPTWYTMYNRLLPYNVIVVYLLCTCTRSMVYVIVKHYMT